MTAIRTFGLISRRRRPCRAGRAFGELRRPQRRRLRFAVHGAWTLCAGPLRRRALWRSPGLRPGSLCSDPGLRRLSGCGFMQPTSGGPEGALPPALDAPGASTMPPMPASPRPYLPFAPNADLPHGQLQLATFGQVNSTTDPFNPWGLSTPFMFVPWSTPLSGWANSQTWNWWRERSGALPRNW